MRLHSKRLGWLDVEDKSFSSGGAGQVHRALDANRRTYCVKLLTKPKADDFAKIEHMAENPPAPLSGGWGQLCWPLDLVRSQAQHSKAFGYVMPMAITGSVELSHVTNLRWPGRNPPPLAQKLDRCSAQGLARRMYLACNIAAAVNEIHKFGCVFVDLKPQNILVAPDGAVSLVDLDSAQCKVGTKVYRGPLGSAEYMPSESYKMDFSTMPVIDPSWDRFSLAVIIYEILLGIHPFSATAKPTVIGCETIEESIRFMMYVHGKNRANLDTIPAPHAGIAKMPTALAQLFQRAFDSQLPAHRPSNMEWGIALRSAAQGSDVSLASRIYAPPAPSGLNKAKRAVVPDPSPLAASSAAPIPPHLAHLVERCYGPWGQTCPGEQMGKIRIGLPNVLNTANGRRVFLCADCRSPALKASPAILGTQKCYGPRGRSCPHELAGWKRTGQPNAYLGSGAHVFLCADCIVEPRSN